MHILTFIINIYELDFFFFLYENLIEKIIK